ncbi:MAG TPA: hypothetical protein VGW96_00790, partial [Candidatus Eremiobacteraceae bacterium]|nr:hypothetical protein [Candidatus Eremiobacteraceae bacterium]
MRVLSIALCSAFVLCVIGLTANVAEAAGGKISGEVVDANSRQPLPGVSVVAEGPMTARTLTVSNG